jgi:hypothetical protein
MLVVVNKTFSYAVCYLIVIVLIRLNMTVPASFMMKVVCVIMLHQVRYMLHFVMIV